jgi:hypothetical protein
MPIRSQRDANSCWLFWSVGPLSKQDSLVGETDSRSDEMTCDQPMITTHETAQIVKRRLIGRHPWAGFCSA